MKFLFISILALLFFPFTAQALSCNLLEGEYSRNLCEILNRVAGILYVVGGGLALVVILTGGISIMTAGENEEYLKKGKKILKNGLIGAAIILCAGFILSLLVSFLYPLFI